MNKCWIALFALALAAPAFAQDEPAAEVVPADEPPAESAEPAAEAPAEEAVTEEAPAEESAEAAEESTPWLLYVGADYVNTVLSLSAPPSAPASEFDSSMVRVRGGWRALDGIALEAHFGIDQADEDAGEVTTDAYYGAFIVPNATLFDVLELAFPVGYARSEFGDSGDALGSVAFGVDLELPIKSLWESLPDVRLTGGWMVYYQKSDARVYGANFGLRYDFSL
jgi:hypothetical protein